MNFLRFLIVATLALAATRRLPAAGARHVVMVVWDGMRPDFITEENTPTLFRLRRDGVYFRNHHSVFVSSTEVNGVALGTGMLPRSSGVMANREFRPAINPQQAIAIEDEAAGRRGDALTGGHYLQAATVAEILRAQTPARTTAIAGSKPVARLLDRKERPGPQPAVLLAEGTTLPPGVGPELTGELGAFPAINRTKIDRDHWTTRALVEKFWAKGVPDFSVLWLAEPDWTQHETGPGSPASLAAIHHSDEELAVVLGALATRNVLADTDILVVSDHGFSTIDRVADVAADLSRAGLSAGRALTGPPAAGSVLVVGNGGSANLYVAGHDAAATARAIRMLQAKPYTGVIFTRSAVPGTFPLSLAGIDTAEAPDIVIAFRWSGSTSGTGAPGLLVSEAAGGRVAGQGTHASLSPYDLRNTLVASGPDFLRAMVDELPSGNADLAPTVLWLLGVKPPVPMEGRVLVEALRGGGPAPTSFDTTRHEATAPVGGARWRQYLKISTVSGRHYVDEGNGELLERGSDLTPGAR